MAYTQDKLKELNQKFKEQLLVDHRPIQVGLMDPTGTLDENEIWYFRDATGQEQDRMIKVAESEGMYAGICEAILVRCVDETGARLFPEAYKPTIRKLPPDLVYAIGSVMKPFDDIAPTAEDAKKNYSSAQKSATASLSALDGKSVTTSS